MGNATTTKSQRRRLRRQRQARRIRAKLNSKDGLPQVHPQQNFYDLLTDAQMKALKPFVGEQVKQLGQAIARNVLKITADFNLRINVLEQLAVSTGAVANEQVLLDMYTDAEDKALGLTKSDGPAEEGDYVRFTATDTADPNARAQNLSVEKLATQPYEANETVEKAIVGMIAGDKKTVKAVMPDGTEHEFDIVLVRASKRPPAAPAK